MIIFMSKYHFHVKISINLLVKTFATQRFFTDHLNHKAANKTTCRTPSANLCQL